MTPPEVFRWSNHHENPGEFDHEWLVRVIPNKFPIADIHEVVIHSPDHSQEMTELPEYHSEIILKVFLQRYQMLSKKGSVLIFTNKGAKSGESLSHPHSQIVVLPRQIKLDVISLQPVNNIVEESAHYVVYCPDFSQWPYEMWISLKKFHEPSFVDRGTTHFNSITEEELTDLARVLRRTLINLELKFPKSAYNYYIHPYSPWYLRIIPRFVTRAGFELGTGLYVNIKDPAEAAKELMN
jgi:UDPglucose--hexose-1-phosphate uridylyltransferase